MPIKAFGVTPAAARGFRTALDQYGVYRIYEVSANSIVQSSPADADPKPSRALSYATYGDSRYYTIAPYTTFTGNAECLTILAPDEAPVNPYDQTE